MGRLIHEHVLLYQERADYGAKTLPRLASDLHLDRSVLLRCVQFFRAFPIVAHGRQLNWAHYRLLIPLEDKKLRLQLAAKTAKHNWTSPELAARIQGSRQPIPTPEPVVDVEYPSPSRLTPKRGTTGVCLRIFLRQVS